MDVKRTFQTFLKIFYSIRAILTPKKKKSRNLWTKYAIQHFKFILPISIYVILDIFWGGRDSERDLQLFNS